MVVATEDAAGPLPPSETGRPAPALRPWVERYVGYRLEGAGGTIHRGLPSPYMTLIASIGAPIDVVAQTHPSQGPERYRVVLGGLQDNAARIALAPVEEGVAVQLTPLGFRALLGTPARTLWNLSVEAADVLGPVGDELWERLQAPPTSPGRAGWRERFATCDEVLARALVGDDRPPPELARAWQLVVTSGGRLATADVAAEVGWSRQHLTRRFRDEFGLAPKTAARVVRFDRARRTLGSGAASVADVAATTGFADQAHLTREFTALAGCPPARWLAEEGHARVPSVQDDGPGAGG
jgi:AraC-like DNA-binding protein